MRDKAQVPRGCITSLAKFFRIGLKLLILCSMLPTDSAYAGGVPPRSTLQVSIPRSEACISVATDFSTHVNASVTVVSVANMRVPERARHAYEHADRALTTEHNFTVAQKELDKTMSIYPKSAVGWCLMGTLHHEEQLKLDEAFADYSQALSIESQILPAYLGLARIAFREERWQDVAEFADQVTKVNPVAFPVAHLYKAAAYFNLGDLSAAEKNARKFQSLDREHERPQVYLLLGDILAYKHDYKKAAEQKRIFLMIVPDVYDANDIEDQIRTLEDLASRDEDGRAPGKQGGDADPNW